MSSLGEKISLKLHQSFFSSKSWRDFLAHGRSFDWASPKTAEDVAEIEDHSSRLLWQESRVP